MSRAKTLQDLLRSATSGNGKGGSYRPLPLEVTIKKSEVEGLGIFATEDIKEGHELGVTHVRDGSFEDDYIRTPLGGFFNHSSNPNCEAYKDGRYIRLKSIKDISSGDELTAEYWLYQVD